MWVSNNRDILPDKHAQAPHIVNYMSSCSMPDNQRSLANLDYKTAICIRGPWVKVGNGDNRMDMHVYWQVQFVCKLGNLELNWERASKCRWRLGLAWESIAFIKGSCEVKLYFILELEQFGLDHTLPSFFFFWVPATQCKITPETQQNSSFGLTISTGPRNSSGFCSLGCVLSWLTRPGNSTTQVPQGLSSMPLQWERSYCWW